MATSTFYPAAGASSPVDGYTGTNTSGTFSEVMAANGVFASATSTELAAIRLETAGIADNFSRNQRVIFGFDTSAIPDIDTVTGATLSVYFTATTQGLGDTDLDLVSASPGSESNIVAGDYQSNFGSTRLATGFSLSGISPNAYNGFTLNASGLSHISKTGTTFFGMLLKWDLDDSFTGTWAGSVATNATIRFADYAGTAYDPKLVVEHSEVTATFTPSVMIF